MNRLALSAPAIVLLVVLTVAGWIPCAFATKMPPSYDPVPTEIAVASAALGGLNVGTSYVNMNSSGSQLSPSWARYVGPAGGIAGIMLGGTLLVQNDYEESTMLGVSSVLMGTIATIAGLSSVAKARNASATSSIHSDRRQISLAPAFYGGPGLGVRLRF